jgi:hypothetical protein
MMQCTRVAIVLLASLPLAAQSGWVQRSPAHVPPVRAWHGLSYDLFHDVHVLFGGGSTGAMLGDTWQWNGIDWQQIAPTRSPPARCCHAMAYDVSLGCVVLHGGRDNAGIVLDDTWQFDGANWVQQAPAQTPGARQTAGMAFSFARFHTILFGGNGGTPLAPRNDTWEWNGSNWSQVVTAHRPPPRSAFAITSDIVQGRVVLFGGLSGTDLSDLWSFDGFDWSALPAPQARPARCNSAMAADTSRGMLVQFGGLTITQSQTPTDETWLYDGSDWRLDLRPNPPLARRAFDLSHGLARDRFVLFGGFNGTYMNQTWEYDLAGAALWLPAGLGCAGTAGVPVLQLVGPQRAISGTTFTMQVSGGVSGFAVFAFGFSATSWNGNPLPLSLASYGMPGCWLYTSVDELRFAAALGSTASLPVAVPPDPGLVGLTVFVQALVPQAAVNPFGAVVSNASRIVVGSF